MGFGYTIPIFAIKIQLTRTSRGTGETHMKDGVVTNIQVGPSYQLSKNNWKLYKDDSQIDMENNTHEEKKRREWERRGEKWKK